MSKKNDLRLALIAARRALAPDVRAQWDAAIGARVLSWWNDNPMRSMGIYWPVQGEPNLKPLYAELTARGVTLALPVVVEKHAPLKFSVWKPGEPLMKDAHGVLIPAERRAHIEPELILVPCVGFNAGRYRLGYGAGYYDRTLAREPRPKTLGIAYSCGLAAFEAAAHDVALDAIVTEEAGVT